jgi:hypothetical protein
VADLGPPILYWFDTEFMENGDTIELLSIGVVCEDGREYYAESSDANWAHANPWVRENVLPWLGNPTVQRDRAEIAADLMDFVDEGGGNPQFWAYYCAYDWVVLCWLYGAMVDLPHGWPMHCMDVQQLYVELGSPPEGKPKQVGIEHHALEDARWTREAYECLRTL